MANEAMSKLLSMTEVHPVIDSHASTICRGAEKRAICSAVVTTSRIGADPDRVPVRVHNGNFQRHFPERVGRAG